MTNIINKIMNKILTLRLIYNKVALSNLINGKQ